MKIELQEIESDLIATDDGDGEFFESADGVITYQGPDDSEWYVNSNKSKFLESLKAYESYINEVVLHGDEHSQAGIVKKFVDNLQNVENFANIKNSYWQTIAVQAEEGQI